MHNNVVFVSLGKFFFDGVQRHSTQRGLTLPLEIFVLFSTSECHGNAWEIIGIVRKFIVIGNGQVIAGEVCSTSNDTKISLFNSIFMTTSKFLKRASFDYVTSSEAC